MLKRYPAGTCCGVALLSGLAAPVALDFGPASAATGFHGVAGRCGRCHVGEAGDLGAGAAGDGTRRAAGAASLGRLCDNGHTVTACHGRV